MPGRDNEVVLDESMSVYKVGEPYLPGRASWPEAAEYNFRQGHHELRFFFRSPSASEVSGICKGTAEFAVAVEEGVVFLLYQFGTHPASQAKALPWSDAPYSWWLVPEGQHFLPNPEPEEERPLLQIILVDAGTGLILGLRVVSLPPGLAVVLTGAIRAQASVPFPGQREYDAAIARVYKRYPDTLGLVRDAHARGKGGE